MAKPRGIDELFAEVRKEAKAKSKWDKYLKAAADIRLTLFPCQVRLDQDPARRVSVRAARRTGKSTGALRVITIRCLEQPGALWVIIGLTRMSVKRNYWADFQMLNEHYELGIKFQHQELTATFPNGSKIYFVGADNASEAEKLRGGKYDGVLIDECKSYATTVFEELIQDVIEPALLDRRGQLIIIGTPGDQLAGPFYLATTEEAINVGTIENPRLSNRVYGTACEVPFIWSLHAWTLRDNTHVFRDRKGNSYTLWDEAKLKKEEKGWDDNHPTWKREYLGHWVANNTKYVYRVRPHIHCYRPLADTLWGLPETISGQKVNWRTCVGVDLGTKDGTAIVVWAFSDNHPGLWELHSEKRIATSEQHVNVGMIARWYKELEDRYGPFESGVIDTAANGTLVNTTLGDEYGVYLEPAEKKEKNDHIELFNNDLDSGQIHLLADGELVREMLGNLWLEKTLGTNNKKEDPETPNDLCDAALYSFRWSLHRQAHLRPEAVKDYSPEWWQIQQQNEMNAAIKAAMDTRSNSLMLDKDWWNVSN